MSHSESRSHVRVAGALLAAAVLAVCARARATPPASRECGPPAVPGAAAAPQAEPFGLVVGHVATAEGCAMPGTQVVLLARADAPFGSATRGQLTDESGGFVFDSLPRGAHWFEVRQRHEAFVLPGQSDTVVMRLRLTKLRLEPVVAHD
jgi:hypothetical protein